MAPHVFNVWVHVAAGAIALTLGAIPLLTIKGGALHRRAGLAFVAITAVMLGTALIGDELARARPLDHGLKMTGAYFALASAGNLFRDLQPWSQVGPSILGFAVRIALALAYLSRNGLVWAVGHLRCAPNSRGHHPIGKILSDWPFPPLAKGGNTGRIEARACAGVRSIPCLVRTLSLV